MQRNWNKRKATQKKRFYQRMEALFLVIFLLLLTVISARLIKSTLRQSEERESKQAMSDLSSVAAEDEQALSPSAQKLLEQNADFVGMVEFGDMALYVCQAADNFYYASHRFDGSEDEAGMVYMDCRCSIDPISDNIVLYGHNMRDGSRFGKLNRYESVDYLLEHPTIRFAGLYETKDYYPLAVFFTTVNAADDEYFNFARIHFADQADFDRYISEIKARSIYYIPVSAQYGDRLLTLATCSEEMDGGRLVIVCREVK